MNPIYNSQQNDVRLAGGIGGPFSGFGVLPGYGFGRPGVGLGGVGLPFLTGIAAGALLTPRRRTPYPYPVYPYPQYPPYPYPQYPYPQYPPYPY